MASGDKITKVNDRLYLVSHSSNSSPDYVYKVKWSKKGQWKCNCTAHANSRGPCQHIFAIIFLLRLPEIIMLNNGALRADGVCQRCGSSELAPYGHRYNKTARVRRMMCNSCGRTSKDTAALQNLSSNIALIIISIDLFYKKLSYREIQNHLLQIYGIHKPLSTIRNWILKFTKITVNAVRKLKIPIPNGGRWLADEMVIKVSGKKKYLWNILDYRSRRQIVSVLLNGRGQQEAAVVIAHALQQSGGNKPAKVLTDGLGSYTMPLKENGIPHEANVALVDKKSNNRVERLHGSIRQFVKAKRGLKGNASLILEGHAAYYNFIKPHSALNGHCPVQIDDKNQAKWSIILRSGWNPVETFAK